MESLVSTDTRVDSNTSINLWNPWTGTKLLALKGPPAAPASLVLLRDEGLLMAEATGKPFLHLWQVGSQLQSSKRIICPLGAGGQSSGQGSSSAGQRLGPLTASPDGNFLVVAISEKINIWQPATGRVAVVLSSAHYRPVTVLKFTDDGSFLISGGGDGIVSVWNFLQLVSGASTTPTYSFSHHTLPVTSAHVGIGGSKSTLFTSSEDRFVKIYSLLGGSLLLSIAFPQPLTCLVADPTESSLFIGGASGTIYIFNLATPPRSLETQVLPGSDSLEKHPAKVTALAISADGKHLASGDAGGAIFLWEVESRQAIKTIGVGLPGPGAGAVTNLAFWLNYPELLKGGGGKKPRIHFPEVPKLIEAGENEGDEDALMRVYNWDGENDDIWEDGKGGGLSEINELKDKLIECQDINRKLHQFCVERLFIQNRERLAAASGEPPTQKKSKAKKS